MNKAFISHNVINNIGGGANGYEYVDLGLSVNWATCNIGANKPEDYGLYFAWGETTGYSSASEKNGGFDFSTTPYWVSGSWASTKWSKYTATNGYSSTGTADNKLVLELEDDAAHVILGGDWRMPTKEEFGELYNACNITWTTQNGVNGLLFKLKADSSKTLFFPAAGEMTGSSIYNVGVFCDYWSSSLYTSASYIAWYLVSDSDNIYPQSNSGRYFGQSIRAVLPK